MGDLIENHCFHVHCDLMLLIKDFKDKQVSMNFFIKELFIKLIE